MEDESSPIPNKQAARGQQLAILLSPKEEKLDEEVVEMGSLLPSKLTTETWKRGIQGLG